MSKSLKNFITIDVSYPTFWHIALSHSSPCLQEILQKYTARQLRLAFLTQFWNAKIDFSESLMVGEVRNIEASFNVKSHSFVCILFLLTARFTELLYSRKGSREPGTGRGTPVG